MTIEFERRDKGSEEFEGIADVEQYIADDIARTYIEETVDKVARLECDSFTPERNLPDECDKIPAKTFDNEAKLWELRREPRAR